MSLRFRGLGLAAMSSTSDAEVYEQYLLREVLKAQGIRRITFSSSVLAAPQNFFCNKVRGIKLGEPLIFWEVALSTHTHTLRCEGSGKDHSATGSRRHHSR